MTAQHARCLMQSSGEVAERSQTTWLSRAEKIAERISGLHPVTAEWHPSASYSTRGEPAAALVVPSRPLPQGNNAEKRVRQGPIVICASVATHDARRCRTNLHPHMS